ncbi:integrin alpha-9-like [Lampetra fluviatilis]
MLRAPGLCACRLLLLLLVHVTCTALRGALAYNLDVAGAALIRGAKGTFFGFSVLQHAYENDTWVLIGAPQAQSGAERSGAVFKCHEDGAGGYSCSELPIDKRTGNVCGTLCRETRADQWLGVSLAREAGGGDSKVMACAHRRANVNPDDIFPHGICFLIPPDLKPNAVTHTSPCSIGAANAHDEMRQHASCQAGMAASSATQNFMVLGGPGSFNWAGTVMLHNVSSGLTHFSTPDTVVTKDSYLGYSVSAGIFYNRKTLGVVAGAPRQDNVGKVYLLTLVEGELQITWQSSGKQLGSYFGSATCAVDLDADGLADLLVGAPQHSETRDEGRVHVFMNAGQGNLVERKSLLSGANAYNAHFGQVIVALGDINDDRFEDVAIGAPHEDDLRGAVYIYNGGPSGISHSFSQRILGRRVNAELSMFGHSISGVIDMDRNGYPDVTVGAFNSDAAVVFRAKAVVTVRARVSLPSTVNASSSVCPGTHQQVNCIIIRVCFTVTGRNLPSVIGLQYNLTADIRRRELGFQSRMTVGSLNNSASFVSRHMAVRLGDNCQESLGIIKREVVDVFQPVVVEVTYGLLAVAARPSDVRPPPLQPMLRPRAEGHVAWSQTLLQCHSVNTNCTPDLWVEVAFIHSGSEHPGNNVVAGNTRTLLMHVSVHNRGDTAHGPSLSVAFPRPLHYIKALVQGDDPHSCAPKASSLVCTLGPQLIEHNSTRKVGIMFDTNMLAGDEGELPFNISVKSETPEADSTLEDNYKKAVVHVTNAATAIINGTVSPALFYFGKAAKGDQTSECLQQTVIFSIKVTNMGPSRVRAAWVQLLVPGQVSSNTPKLFSVLETKVGGQAADCVIDGAAENCHHPDVKSNPGFFQNLFNIINSKHLKVTCGGMARCVNITCPLGSLHKGSVRDVDIRTLLDTRVLEMDRAAWVQLDAEASVTLHGVAPDGGPTRTTVTADAKYELREAVDVVTWSVVLSSLAGVLVLSAITFVLWKVGFCKRTIPVGKPRRRNAY